ncbi:hypothetical protein GEOBRER4_n0060 [Citrifermentans bremense]|uniref:Uncharacterized protein n=2 Tax=Geobacteraceae TaxID=213422 RepID=A0ABQ0MMF0_9BACT|nr:MULTISPECIES: hypothetical protein [Geobacteraceae]BCG45307.1 hypothetical protein GEOBRER4_n0060 [Citrifermentans bremense]GAW68265.1 hypothetical protein GPEL0_01f4526 [Geoanaerobacter pelophilus]
MKRIITMAAGLFVALSLTATAYAAPKGANLRKSSPGIENSKKVMQYRMQRDKKMQDVRKKGQLKRQQAQAGK